MDLLETFSLQETVEESGESVVGDKQCHEESRRPGHRTIHKEHFFVHMVL
jgi:hypothetical protein